MESKGIKGIFKRALPFLGTFALGLFIASFFVDIGPQRFRGHRGKRHNEVQRLRNEVEQLKNENLRLQNELDNHDWTSHAGRMRDFEHETWTGSELPLMPPPAPAAPIAPTVE
ncbi:MAG: hypothetical protein WKF34_09725 [Pyrinomonadaceae bacterium]